MSNVFAFLGAQEVVVILVIALLIFGPNKLPEIGRQIAMGLREMRRMSSEVQSALDLHVDDYRYGSSHYDTSAGGGENDAYGGEPLVNTRPWSVAESAEASPDPVPGEHDLLAARTDGQAQPPVMTVEPPGPPILRQPPERSGNREEL